MNMDKTVQDVKTELYKALNKIIKDNGANMKDFHMDLYYTEDIDIDSIFTTMSEIIVGQKESSQKWLGSFFLSVVSASTSPTC